MLLGEGKQHCGFSVVSFHSVFFDGCVVVDVGAAFAVVFVTFLEGAGFELSCVFLLFGLTSMLLVVLAQVLPSCFLHF